MNLILYIRHGEDKRNNYRDDAELTDFGRQESRELAKKLLDEFGIPDVIYYSPFQRTRATKKEMVKVIKKYKEQHNIHKKIRMVSDPRLGRFFSNSERDNPEVHHKTMKKGAFIWENKKQFDKRVFDQLNDCKKEKIVWNITHTLVLLKIVKIEGVKRSRYVDYLDYVLIKK